MGSSKERRETEKEVGTAKRRQKERKARKE